MLIDEADSVKPRDGVLQIVSQNVRGFKAPMSFLCHLSDYDD